MDPLLLFAYSTAVLSVLCLAGGIVAIRRRRFLPMSAGLLLGLLLLSLSALAGTISVATRGYRALTLEEVAATVVTRPAGPRSFMATVTFPDGRQQTHRVAGDQLYVDAHILKWKPIANILGLHTAYELDRVGGRYVDLQQERDSLRTLYSLKTEKRFDMFTLRQRYGLLAPLLDTEYGSATFVAVSEPAEFEVRVSTSGLLIRRVS